jgi:hypothetical protein
MPLQPNGLIDLHAQWVKWRGLLWGSAFWGRIDKIIHFGVKTPQNPQFWNWDAQFPAKSIHSNNCWTLRGKWKIPTDCLYKIGIGESYREAISVVGRHPATKTTSGPILKALQSRLTCERLEIDEKLQCNTKRRPMSGYWMGTSDLLRNVTLRSKQLVVRFWVSRLTLLNW